MGNNPNSKVCDMNTLLHAYLAPNLPCVSVESAAEAKQQADIAASHARLFTETES